MTCPQCTVEMRDLRPKSNPKAPDFVCDTEGCGKTIKGTWRQTAVWLDRQAQKPAPSASQAPPKANKWTWLSLSKTYEWSLLAAEMRVTASADRLGTKATVGDVLQATATIFIEACRSGVEPPKAKLPPKPAPEPEASWEELQGEPAE